MKREKWPRACLLCASFIIALILLFGGTTRQVFAQTNPDYPKVLRFAALSPGTLLHATLSGLAKVASDNSPMTMAIIPTAGPSAWLPMLSKQGTADVALDIFPTLWQMWTGKIAPEPVPKGFPSKPLYPGETKNIRIIVAGAQMSVGMLVRKDSEIKTYSDLPGKKIAWKWTAFPSNIAITLALLFNGGLTLDDVKTLPVTEVVAAVKAVQERRLDATACATGMGAIAEADALVGVRFLPNSLDPERVKAGQRAMPGCYTGIQRGGIPGVPEDMPLWFLPTAVLATTRMADHVAYKLVETWWDHHKEYAPIHPFLKRWTPDTFVSKHTTIPYHNGAIQFFKEKGVWSPEMEEIQNRLLSTK
jgi:TRAP transporter TAXI family solute receptor